MPKAKPVIRYKEPLGLSDELRMLKDKEGLEIDKNNLVELTKSNSEIIEKLIKEDDGYIDFSKIVFEHVINENGADFASNADQEKRKEAWTKLVRMIDLVNYTQVWRFKRDSLKELVNFIINDKNAVNIIIRK